MDVGIACIYECVHTSGCVCMAQVQKTCHSLHGAEGIQCDVIHGGHVALCVLHCLGPLALKGPPVNSLALQQHDRMEDSIALDARPRHKTGGVGHDLVLRLLQSTGQQQQQALNMCCTASVVAFWGPESGSVSSEARQHSLFLSWQQQQQKARHPQRRLLPSYSLRSPGLGQHSYKHLTCALMCAGNQMLL